MAQDRLKPSVDTLREILAEKNSKAARRNLTFLARDLALIAEPIEQQQYTGLGRGWSPRSVYRLAPENAALANALLATLRPALDPESSESEFRESIKATIAHFDQAAG